MVKSADQGTADAPGRRAVADTACDNADTASDGADVAVVEDVNGRGVDELGARWRVITDPDAWSDPTRLGRLLAGARALVVRNRTQVTGDVLRAAQHLEVVARAGVGLDNIDVAAADELGVVVVAAVGANAQSVGEHALALALALARDVVGHDRRVRQGGWDRSAGTELAGRTWAVVGLGATGLATARLAAALGMTVVGHDPFLPPTAPLGGLAVEHLADLDEALGRADVVSLHLAASDQTKGMVGATFLAAMRPGALLVNVARGELVDEDALLAALDDGTLGGAGLDVRASEPPGRHHLAEHPRVVSTPHVAGMTAASQDRVVDMISADVARVLGGEEAHHAVGRHRRRR